MVEAKRTSEGKIEGRVSGSTSKPYRVMLVVYLEENDFDSSCSCPIGGACKHVAALGLEALKTASIDLPNLSKITQISSSPKAWEKNLEQWYPQTTFSRFGNPHASNSQINQFCLLFRLERTLEYDFPSYQSYYSRKKPQRTSSKPAWNLQVRVATFNLQTQKIEFQNLNWNTLHYSNSDFNTSSRIYLEHLHGILRDSYYNSSSWLMLPNKKHALFWEWIQRHKSFGVPLFHNQKNKHPVKLDLSPIEFQDCLENDGDGLILKKVPFLNEERVDLGGWILGGSPPRWALRMDRPDQPDSGAWQLHPIEGIFPENFKIENVVHIPFADLDHFKKIVLPKIIKHTPVKNFSALKIPTVGNPELFIDILKYGKNGLKLVLGWQYDSTSIPFNDSRETISSNDNLILRDVTNEKTILSRFQATCGDLMEILPDLILLEGIKAALWMEQKLPLLKQDPSFYIRESIDLPIFTHYQEAPAFEFDLEKNPQSQDWFDLNVKVKIGKDEVPFQSIFEALARKEDHLFLESGIYFSLNHPQFEKIRTLIEESQTIHDLPKGEYRLSLFQASLWQELTNLGVVQKQAAVWENAMNKLLNVHAIELLKPQKSLKATLRPYQIEGLSWLKFLYEHGLGGILADDMGLGKTVQVLAFISELFANSKNKKTARKPILVVAPTSVVENWDLEMERFTPHLKRLILRKGDRSDLYKKMRKNDVVIVSYALLVRDFKPLSAIEWDTLFLDEAQFVKNHQSKAYGCIRKLNIQRRFALTGTPMENNLLELWSIFSIVSPGLFGSPTWFREQYQKPIEKLGDTEALQRLRQRIRPFLMRRRKEMVATELPPKIEQVLFLDLDHKHRALYDRQLQYERQKVLGLLAEGGLKENRFQILQSLTKLRQFCLHPGLVDDKYLQVPAIKLDALMEHVQMLLAEGHRALIFSQFTSFLSHVKQRFETEKLPYLYLDGKTQNRQQLITSFQSKNAASLFLISLKAGGFGLNLTQADYCILLDPWWNPAAENQAVDRTHRIGQDKQVIVYKLIAKNTVEEKVLQLQAKKSKLFKSVLEEGDQFASLITENDIREIFA